MIYGEILNKEFYLQNTLDVAKALLGCYLVVEKEKGDFQKAVTNNSFAGEIKDFYIGRIVENEAYLGHRDSAAHSYNKQAGGRSDAMFRQGGNAYVYLIYGMYHCLNCVTQPAGTPEGVLLRALEPLDDNINHRALAGPGKICKEFGIDRTNNYDLLHNSEKSRILVIKPNNFIIPKIVESKRIGINPSNPASEYLYRFYDDNSKSISKK